MSCKEIKFPFNYEEIEFYIGGLHFVQICKTCLYFTTCSRIAYVDGRPDIKKCVASKKLLDDLKKENQPELPLGLESTKISIRGTLHVVIPADMSVGIDGIYITKKNTPPYRLSFNILNPCMMCISKDNCPNRTKLYNLKQKLDPKAGCGKVGAFLRLMELLRTHNNPTVAKVAENVH